MLQRMRFRDLRLSSEPLKGLKCMHKWITSKLPLTALMLEDGAARQTTCTPVFCSS